MIISQVIKKYITQLFSKQSVIDQLDNKAFVDELDNKQQQLKEYVEISNQIMKSLYDQFDKCQDPFNKANIAVKIIDGEERIVDQISLYSQQINQLNILLDK